MNKQKFLTLGLAVVLFAASCKKQDVEIQEAPTPAPDATEWKTAASWTSSREANYTSFTTSLQDRSITADVIENGIVLVYAKYGNEVFSLPHQSKGSVNASWHYQVVENTISIDVDVYSENAEIDNKQHFNYFILTSDKIKSLEGNGHSISELMILNYENAKNLLK